MATKKKTTKKKAAKKTGPSMFLATVTVTKTFLVPVVAKNEKAAKEAARLDDNENISDFVKDAGFYGVFALQVDGIVEVSSPADLQKKSKPKKGVEFLDNTTIGEGADVGDFDDFDSAAVLDKLLNPPPDEEGDDAESGDADDQKAAA